MRAIATLIILAITALATAARAHDSRPLFIELSALPDGRVSLKSTAPAAVGAEGAPLVTLGGPCREISRSAADPRRQRALYECALGAAEIRIDWPTFNPSISALVRVDYGSGETRTEILDPAQTSWRAPAPETLAGVSKSYFRIGVDHIIGGIDHLLFLAGLLIIAGSLKRTVITATGFTIAHSLTLALVALGFMRISVPAVEAVIALSIVFLATEIARGDRTTLAWRRPALVASAFGLAHGAGFAAALGEIGLPKGETLAALFFFNVGVEAGQVAIIAAVFVALFALRRASAEARALTNLSLATRAAGYALGVVSAYWFVERAAALLTPA